MKPKKIKGMRCRMVRRGRTLTWPDGSFRGVGGIYNVRVDDPFVAGLEHVLESSENSEAPTPVTERQYLKVWRGLPELPPKEEKSKKSGETAKASGGGSGSKQEKQAAAASSPDDGEIPTADA